MQLTVDSTGTYTGSCCQYIHGSVADSTSFG